LRVVAFGNDLEDAEFEIFVMQEPVIDEGNIRTVRPDLGKESKSENPNGDSADAETWNPTSQFAKRRIDSEAIAGTAAKSLSAYSIVIILSVSLPQNRRMCETRAQFRLFVRPKRLTFGSRFGRLPDSAVVSSDVASSDVVSSDRRL
jgi:hypothetical protein